jgi:hypothetical protein
MRSSYERSPLSDFPNIVSSTNASANWGLARSWGEEGKRRRGREERLEWSITPWWNGCGLASYGS